MWRRRRPNQLSSANSWTPDAPPPCVRSERAPTRAAEHQCRGVIGSERFQALPHLWCEHWNDPSTCTRLGWREIPAPADLYVGLTYTYTARSCVDVTPTERSQLSDAEPD